MRKWSWQRIACGCWVGLLPVGCRSRGAQAPGAGDALAIEDADTLEIASGGGIPYPCEDGGTFLDGRTIRVALSRRRVELEEGSGCVHLGSSAERTPAVKTVNLAEADVATIRALARALVLDKPTECGYDGQHVTVRVIRANGATESFAVDEPGTCNSGAIGIRAIEADALLGKLQGLGR